MAVTFRRPAWMLALMGLCLALLSACGEPGIWASDADVQAARYAHDGAAELTLVTIMHHRSGRGDHTALFINGRERVIFDPAGSWERRVNPRRGDVHYGMSPEAGASFYLSHVRETHYAKVQRIAVPLEVAEQAKALALAEGAVGPARCAISTARILRQLPGFGGVGSSFFPQVLMRNFGQIPGVQEYELHHDDPELEAMARRAQAPLSAPQP
ncbi:MAG: hypothetical protein JJU09_13640 [Rhodobacteraceae bacterium]|nr:hypothetical protein [Paracoccaceae bacterium]